MNRSYTCEKCGTQVYYDAQEMYCPHNSLPGTPVRITCPTCHGPGHGLSPLGEYLGCPHCNGTGYVYARKYD